MAAAATANWYKSQTDTMLPASNTLSYTQIKTGTLGRSRGDGNCQRI